MNALSYLTGSSSPSSSLPSLPHTSATSVQEELKLGGNLPNVSEEHEGGEHRIQKHRKEERKLSLIWRIVFFLPLWLIVKPVSLVWFVLTFPLSLIEHTSLKSVIENDSQRGMSLAVLGGEPRAPGELVDDDDLAGESMVLHEDSIKSSRPSTSRSSYTSTRLGKFLFPKKLIPQSILQTDRKKVLVLDLDETLIHSISRTNSSSNTSQGHMVEVTFSISGVSTLYYVHKRPYCDLFLSRVSKWYDLVIFTASMKEYADPVIDWLEGGISAKFSQRKYRSDCILRDGVGYVKDLSIISKSLQDMIIVDNSPVSYAMNVDNAIQVEGWISDPTDTGLLNLLPLLEGLRFTTDTRNILSLKNGERAFI